MTPPLGEHPVLLTADPELPGISRPACIGFEPGLFLITGGIILVEVAVFFYLGWTVLPEHVV